jgi:uncharacterized membrane protein
MGTFHVIAGATDRPTAVTIRSIGYADVGAALRAGYEDFCAKPSHIAFLCLIYPVVGVGLAFLSSGQNALPLLYPLMSGFALLGPFAAIGLYEISRRRERGEDPDWRQAFAVWSAPSVPAILSVGLLLAALFVVWLACARALYIGLIGPTAPADLSTFLREIVTTREGWWLVLIGNAVGFCFALAALSLSVVSFPLLLDRDVGAGVAIQTSLRAVGRNPGPMLAWGLVVALGLVAGFVTLFIGLAVVIPILGHATWHLYRRVVAPSVA